MSESLDDVKRDIERTRERMSQTVVEIEDRVSTRVEAVKQKTDLMELVREHPWPALAVAFGAGVLVSATGADARAAAATAGAAKRAASGTSRVARDTSRKLSSSLHQEERAGSAGPSEPGVLDRVKDAMTAPLRSRVDDLLDLLRAGSRELAAAMIAGSSRRSRRAAGEPTVATSGSREPVTSVTDLSADRGTPTYASPIADAMPNTIVTTDRRDGLTGGASVVDLPPDTAADAIPVPPEMTPPELGVRAEAVEEMGGGTHEPPLEPGAGELGSKWA